MRELWLLGLLLLVMACGSDADHSNNIAASTSTAPAAPPPPAAPTLEEQLAVIKAEYALISQEMEGEVYQADTIAYACEEEMVAGEVLVYSDSEATRLVINNYSVGDHSGKTSYWYFMEGEPFFVLEETGSWQFGGPYREDESGAQIPGTIDKIEQLRYYIAEGTTIRKLRKAFEIKSWEDSPSADEVPNELVKTGGELPIGYDFIQNTINKRTVNCSDLDALFNI